MKKFLLLLPLLFCVSCSESDPTDEYYPVDTNDVAYDDATYSLITRILTAPYYESLGYQVDIEGIMDIANSTGTRAEVNIAFESAKFAKALSDTKKINRAAVLALVKYSSKEKIFKALRSEFRSGYDADSFYEHLKSGDFDNRCAQMVNDIYYDPVTYEIADDHNITPASLIQTIIPGLIKQGSKLVTLPADILTVGSDTYEFINSMGDLYGEVNSENLANASANALKNLSKLITEDGEDNLKDIFDIMVDFTAEEAVELNKEVQSTSFFDWIASYTEAVESVEPDQSQDWERILVFETNHWRTSVASDIPDEYYTFGFRRTGSVMFYSYVLVNKDMGLYDVAGDAIGHYTIWGDRCNVVIPNVSGSRGLKFGGDLKYSDGVLHIGDVVLYK